ncbi:MAG: domain containing protein [Schlesneria sp.]|nr:domain containing protein [Schlesneria sp.]
MAGRDDDANPFAAPESDLEPGIFTPTSDKRVEYANFGQRLIAAIVDNVILQIVGRTIGAGIGAANESMNLEPLVILAISIPIGMGMAWLYEALQESSEAQATLGKRMMGIIVTDMSGQRLSFGQATARYFAKIISWMTCLIGYIIQPFTEQRQALHDIIAKTLVVKA